MNQCFNKSTWATCLPHSMIDVVDHFSLNQCRSEEITLKEDLGNEFLDLVDFGKCICLLIGLSVIIC